MACSRTFRNIFVSILKLISLCFYEVKYLVFFDKVNYLEFFEKVIIYTCTLVICVIFVDLLVTLVTRHGS
jgi:hypothetical protein